MALCRRLAFAGLAPRRKQVDRPGKPVQGVIDFLRLMDQAQILGEHGLQLDEPALTEMMRLTNESLAALRRMYNPQAFNLGANIGAAAGAGIADHVHLHIVPRWAGDTNFMTTVSAIRVIPEELAETYRLAQANWEPAGH